MDRQSEPFTEEMIEEGDMVYAMEHRQAIFLRWTFTGHDPKIFLLPMFDTGPLPAWDYALQYNIPDPNGKSGEDLLECFRRIESSIEGFLSRSDLHPRRMYPS